MPVRIIADDLQDEVAIDIARWADLASSALVTELVEMGAPVDTAEIELTLTCVDVEEMTGLNREQMGVDGPTDVLSFPLDEPVMAVSDEPVLLGDVVICPAIARDAASTHAGTLDDEIALLIVHGILHVLGHDHADVDGAARMRAREKDLLERCHWHGPVPPGFSFEHLDH